MNDLPLFSRLPEREEVSHPAPKQWSVSELTTRIREILEPALMQIWVVGEVSNLRPAASGHVYFSLKDATSCISAAVFGWGARKRSFDLKDGIKVLCRGKVTVYPPRGSYQLVVDHVEPLGAGALQVAFDQLKAKLAAEGLFDASLKRKLPPFPARIAIVTSPSGAAIQDMLNILKRRTPHVRVTVVPAVVQGEDAPAQLIRGLALANQHQLGDVIVLARGGGSIEDLWCFNHEELARAIRKSKIPVVSAVGHEIDFTISDFVSDLRAPTPSAAAELITENWLEAIHRMKDAALRLRGLIQRDLSHRKTLLSHVSARLVSPKDRLRDQIQKTDELFMQLERFLKMRLERKRSSVEQLMGKLDALSPLRVLERGFTLVRDPGANWAVVKSVEQVRSGKELQITFYDGQRNVKAL